MVTHGRARAARVAGLSIAAMLVIGATAVGCSSDTTSSGSGEPLTDVTSGEGGGEPQPGGVLAVGLEAESLGWNPAQIAWSDAGVQVARAIFDPLAAFDEDENLQPYLAESFESNEDFTEWTIGLRDGPEFHDGTPVDAAAVAANLEAHRVGTLTSGIFKPVTAVEVVDPRTVVVTMSTPWATFPGYLAAQPGYVAAPSMLEDPDGGSNPVGSGPFVFEEWLVDASLTVSKNDDYWREGLPYLDGVEFRVLADDSTRIQSLDSGDIEIAQVNLAEQIVELRDRAEAGDVQLLLDEQAETAEIVIGLNTAVAPFDDPVAREAVATAIDTGLLSDGLFAGAFPAARGPLEESSSLFAETDYPDYDPERARTLAEEYEAEHGEPLTFTMKAPPDPAILEISQYLQAQLAEVDIDVEIQSPDQTTLLVDGAFGNFEALAFVTFASRDTEGEYIFLHSSTAADVGQLALNFTRNQNDEMDAALEGIRATREPEEIREHAGVVQEQLASDLSFIFLVHQRAGLVARTNVHGLKATTLPDGEPTAPQQGSVVWLTGAWLS